MKLFDNSIIRRVVKKFYYQQGVNLNVSGKKIVFIFVGNSNCYQIGNAYLQFELAQLKNGSPCQDDSTDVNRKVKNDFENLFKEATIATPGGSEPELNKYEGPISTIMKVLTNEEGQLSSFFDEL